MHKAVKTLLIALLIGVGFGTWLYYSLDHRPVRIAISAISSGVIGSLMMALIYQRGIFLRFTNNALVKVLTMIALLIAVALMGSEIVRLAQSWIDARVHYIPFAGGNLYTLNILIVLVTGIPMYVHEEARSLREATLLSQQYRLLQLEQQQVAFELELLRAKVNPHFLYNMHNTIAGLISQDPEKAEELVLLLSKFFRSTLNKHSSDWHSTADEVEIIDTYLHMQQIRFGKRLDYTIDVAPGISTSPFPSFVLQPLVENGVKHGIEVSTRAGWVRVNIHEEGQQRVVEVADSGPPFPDLPGSGLGLQLVMNKLKLLYDNRYSIELINSPTKHVRITLPTSDKNPAR